MIIAKERLKKNDCKRTIARERLQENNCKRTIAKDDWKIGL